MTLTNQTRKTTVTTNLIEAKSFLAQSQGLLAFDKPSALMIKTRFGIHTFFMRYPIDIIVLDNKMKVVAVKHHLKPNRILLWNPKYETVVELPHGVIKNAGTKVGDKLILEEHEDS